MAEKLHGFDDAHPGYKDAWYEIMTAIHEDHLSAFREAFEKMAKIDREDETETRASKGYSEEKAQELAAIGDQMKALMNRDFKARFTEVFSVFDILAADGEFSLYADSDISRETPEPVTEEEFQAVLDAYNAFKEANPDYAEYESLLFSNRNRIIRGKLYEAHKKAGTADGEAIEAIYEKYRIPEEDRETINNIRQMMMEQINANFLAYVSENQLIGPITFLGVK